jgi:precorrin-6B methylase 2
VIESYIQLLSEDARLETVKRALAVAVRPGDVVVDVGTGTGAFALFAARAGARRVYAVEREEIVEVARSLVQANGAADIVEVIEADAASWVPPEPVDVVVYEDLEDVGIGPTLGSLTSRLRRYLAPGGRFVPESITVRAAPVENEPQHRRGFPWSDGRAYGLNLTPLKDMAAHMRSNCAIREKDLLATPESFFSHRVGQPVPPLDEATARFAVQRGGKMHGVAVWFDAVLATGVNWSNAPSEKPTIWQNAFLHTRAAPDVRRGEWVRVRLSHAPWGAESWIWSWHVQIEDAGGTARYSEQCSEFHSLPMSAARLRARSLDQPLNPDRSAEKQRRVFELVDGHRTAREVGEELSGRFPDLFPDAEQAAREVISIVRPILRRKPISILATASAPPSRQYFRSLLLLYKDAGGRRPPAHPRRRMEERGSLTTRA